MRPVIALLLTVSVFACKSAQPGNSGSAAAGTTTAGGTPPQGSQNADATLTLDRSTYSSGARVVMRVTNRTKDTLGYNQCSSRSIERDRDGSWMAYPEEGRICTMELRLLYPNETQTANTSLPANMPAGTYRIMVILGRQRAAPAGAPSNWGTVRAASPSFRVE